MRCKNTLPQEGAGTRDQRVRNEPISDNRNVPIINAEREYNLNAVSRKRLEALDQSFELSSVHVRANRREIDVRRQNKRATLHTDMALQSDSLFAQKLSQFRTLPGCSIVPVPNRIVHIFVGDRKR